MPIQEGEVDRLLHRQPATVPPGGLERLWPDAGTHTLDHVHQPGPIDRCHRCAQALAEGLGGAQQACGPSRLSVSRQCREPFEAFRNVQDVAERAAYLKRFAECGARRGGVLSSQHDLAQVRQRVRGAPLVTNGSEQIDGFPEQARCRGRVPQIARDQRAAAHRVGLAAAVANAHVQPLRTLEQLPCFLEAAGGPGHRSNVDVRAGLAIGFAEGLPELQALGEERHRFVVVALHASQHTGRVQRHRSDAGRDGICARERGLQPGASLADVPARDPEPVQGACKLESGGQIAVRCRPVEHRPEVAVLRGQSVQGGCHAGSAERRLDLLGESHIVPGMVGADFGELAMQRKLI